MGKTPKPIWARNIMARRKALGFASADDFAEHIGMSSATYRDIEAGVSEGRYENRETIAHGLRCSVADLYQGTNEIILADFSGASDFLGDFSDAPPGVRKVLLSLLYDDQAYLRDVSRADLSHAIKALSAALKPK